MARMAAKQLLLLLLPATATVAAPPTPVIRDVGSLWAALRPLFSADTRGDAGRRLSLAPGDFVLGRALLLPSGVTLRRAAHAQGEVVLRLAKGVPHPVVAITNASGVLLSGVRIAGQPPSQPQRVPALVVLGGDAVMLDHLTVSGGVHIGGGVRHTLRRSVVSNPHGNCVYLSKAGDPLTLTGCGHTISHTEIHDCRGLGDPWPSSQYPCDPDHQKREHKPPCHPDPYPNITGNGVLINQVVGANVSHNKIHDVNYHGIYSQSRIHSRFPDPSETPSANNEISFNHVQDFGQCVEDPVCNMTGLSGKNGNPGADPACIYFFDGPLCCYGTTVRHNFCHNNKQGGKGLYLDGFSSGITTFGNVLWNISGNIIDNNDGHDNHHVANVAINGRAMGSLTDSDFWNCAGTDKDGCGPHNLSKLVGHACTPHFWDHYMNYGTFNQTKWESSFFDSPVWKDSFPSIQSWLKRTTWAGPDGPVSCDQKGQFTDCCMFPTGSSANYSIMVNTPWDAGRGLVQCAHNESRYCSWQNISLAHWCDNSHAFDSPVGCWPIQAHFQRVGPQKLYTSDPGFVDMAAGNFALKPDAQIFSDFPGFPNIPFGQIGPHFAVGHNGIV
jgi:hypothetical protein|eukprot:COSAG01_NODE_689_length_14220_cov_363.812903_9_plen_611_part_00